MNAISASTLAALRRAAIAALPVVLLLLPACGKSPPSDEASAEASGHSAAAADAEQESADPADGVVLNEEEIKALALVTSPARAIRSAPEAQGFGVVMPHDAISQAVSDIRIAVAGVRQSRSALERVRQLAASPGAMPAETQETAERQSAADAAALDLANQHLSSALGEDSPWKLPDNDAEVRALADGSNKLVRVTLPLDAVADEVPHGVRVARVDSTRGGKSWRLEKVWRAPADSTIPGRSFIAVLTGRDIGEGERLLAWVPTGAAENGVLIPAAAAVITGGKFYCYVEKGHDTYVRMEFDPGRPVAEGFFVNKDVAVGEKIVIRGAGQLLAREMNSSKEAD